MTRAALRRCAAAIATTAGVVAMAFACGEGRVTDPVSDASIDASDSGQAFSDGHVEEVNEKPDPPRPNGLAPGWMLERRLSKFCEHYTPASREIFPPAFEWVPCAIAGEAGISCMRLGKKDYAKWPPYVDAAWVDGNGRVHVSAYRRGEPPLVGQYWFIADVDGAVENAIFQQSPGDCRLDLASVFDGRYVVRVKSTLTNVPAAFYGGRLGELTPSLAVRTEEKNNELYAAVDGPIDSLAGNRMDRRSWTDGAIETRISPQPDSVGFQQSKVILGPSAVFWTANNLDLIKVTTSSRERGTLDFLSAGQDFSHAYADLGTDGRDLVWIEAKGRSQGGLTPFDEYAIMTAPYTADPTKVIARRLRSEVGPGIGVLEFIVGCGFAARFDAAHLRILRLSDGVSWVFPSTELNPARPLAITCTEIFTLVGVEGTEQSTLGRIRLDSLGPGIPPD